MDACHAGRLKGSILGGPQMNVEKMMSSFENSTKMLACQPNEVSLESQQWGGGHGVFVIFLLKGLTREGGPE